ncbi:hypothetical protein M113_3853 [Bacteroides fragilis str. 3986 N3]|nr:hypothetical protein M111_3534 [Bacteroides fragilis str. 3986T(B)10]EYA55399.1 hypothetical protein M112_3898 [Bacteroides fragilis str. 3986 T(B)13]EYE65838.1 hypothetical protein M113_3853 [Bacteroides fragilis str. 3986 N3]
MRTIIIPQPSSLFCRVFPNSLFFYFLISCLLYYNQSMQSGTQYYKKIIRKDMINP